MDFLAQAAKLLNQSTFQVLADISLNPLQLHDVYRAKGYRALPDDIQVVVERVLRTYLATKGATYGASVA